MENVVEITSETLRAMFDAEIVKFCEQKWDIRELIEEKYKIGTGRDIFHASAEDYIQIALKIFKSNPTNAMPQFREFAHDLFVNKDFESRLENCEDKEAFASIAECALRIIDCEIEFFQRSGLNALIEATNVACAYTDSNKNWSDWSQNEVCKVVELITSNPALKRRPPLFPLSKSLRAA